MARYQAILAYDGTRFSGFQRQRRVNQLFTIQEVLEEALGKIGWKGEKILVSGRTDGGVHALGQVIAFDFEWAHSEEELCSALNAYLPEDVAVQRICLVPPNFHPRYQAVSRRYRYRLFFAERRNPLIERYAWRVWPSGDISLMQKAAEMFIGVHDFAGFGSPLRSGGSTVREVHYAGWSQWKDDEVSCGWQFEIQANAFLYHMVRRIVYAMVTVGQKGTTLEQIQMALEGQKGVKLGGLAPAKGLTLLEVRY